MKTNSRWKIILVATFFNLLFEYSARGVREFIHRPFLVLALFGIYLTYFTVLEDLMVRLRLKNHQILLVAFSYGMLPETFLTGNLFNPRINWGIMVAGINIGSLIIINIFAWGVIQSIVTLYLANRIFRRDWTHPRMGHLGWTAATGYQLLMVALAQLNPRVPRGQPISYLILALLTAATIILFVRSLKKQRSDVSEFQPEKLMDFFAFGSIILFLVLGSLFSSGPTIVTSQPLNRGAVVIETLWVILVGLAFFIYRYRRGSDVAA